MSMAELSLKASAAFLWLGAVGIGLSATLVASHLLRVRAFPMAMHIRLFGGGAFERWSPEVVVVLLGLLTAICAMQLFAGWLIWNRQQLGATVMLALLPLEVAFWIGFALPYPPPLAAIRLALLGVGWSALG